MIDIQNATRLKVTHLVNSTHLLYETDLEHIEKGEIVCKMLSEKLNIPYKYVVIPQWLICKGEQDKSDKNSNHNCYPIDYLKNKFNAQFIFDLNITLRPVWLSDENI